MVRRTKKAENSSHIAPPVMRPACRRIAGMAMLPTDENPVRNLAASCQLPSVHKPKIKYELNRIETSRQTQATNTGTRKSKKLSNGTVMMI